MFLHLDCRHYRGDRPCRFDRLCEACPHYAPMGKRVLIIKLGALGDVVRTAALLPGLNRLTGEPPYVTWVTSPAALPLVERMPGVARALPFTPETVMALEIEKFDLVLSLDKEPAPSALAMRAQAPQKYGVGLSRYGTAFPLNEEAEYYFQLGLDNPEKFHVNQKSYPQLIFEALGLGYSGERYALEPKAIDIDEAATIYIQEGVPPAAEVIGINPGAGHVYAHKAWRPEAYGELISLLRRARPAAHIALLGGADEAELIDHLWRGAVGREIKGAEGGVHSLGTNHPLGVFMTLIRRVNALVAGDTLAMHLAIAQRRPVVAIFGPTCPQEIDLFGRGEKLVSPIEYAPCYLRACDKSPHCMDMIKSGEVAAAVLRQLPGGTAATG